MNSESLTITDEPLHLPLNDNHRQARAAEFTCKSDNCGRLSNYPAGFPTMAAHCSEIDCPSHNSMPTCWFGAGTTNHDINDYHLFYHWYDSTMTCLPCCQQVSQHPKMPSLYILKFLKLKNKIFWRPIALEI